VQGVGPVGGVVCLHCLTISKLEIISLDLLVNRMNALCVFFLSTTASSYQKLRRIIQKIQTLLLHARRG
jgi:hypothetical protein